VNPEYFAAHSAMVRLKKLKQRLDAYEIDGFDFGEEAYHIIDEVWIQSVDGVTEEEAQEMEGDDLDA